MDVVRSRAARILGHFARYRNLRDGTATPPAWLRQVAVQGDEVVLGVYENVPGELEDSIVVTTRALHLCRDGAWQSVSYEDIRSIETPPTEAPLGKSGVAELTLHLGDGQRVSLPVTGGRGKTRDAWEFLRFLRRVTSDLERASGGARSEAGQHPRR